MPGVSNVELLYKEPTHHTDQVNREWFCADVHILLLLQQKLWDDAISSWWNVLKNGIVPLLVALLVVKDVIEVQGFSLNSRHLTKELD